MIIKCCNQDIIPEDIWFLQDYNGFVERFLLLGFCNICNNKLATLVQIRQSDNQPFVTNLSGKSAETIIKKEKQRIIYSSATVHNYSSGWNFGVNIQIKDKSGRIKQLRQYASDFFGNKKLIKKVFI